MYQTTTFILKKIYLPFLVKVAGRSVLLVGLPATVDNTADMDLMTVHNNL